MARLPLAQLAADESHVHAFNALAHLNRLQVFFALVKAERELSVGEIQELALLLGAVAFVWLRPADLAGDRAVATPKPRTA